MSEDETAYVQGSQRAWLTMLQLCLRQLGADHPEANAARWVSERAETVLALRTVCAEFGDNDWEDVLHLSDVIEKHLARRLQEQSEPVHALIDQWREEAEREGYGDVAHQLDECANALETALGVVDADH